MKLDKERLDEFFDYLLENLEIGNYKVTYDLLSTFEMHEIDNTNSDGLFRGDFRNEVAEIFIDKDLETRNNYPDKFERVMIHEFIHLLMYEFDRYINSNFHKTYKDEHFIDLEEQFVNRMVNSILNLISNKYK